jgi:hypothetical protein
MARRNEILPREVRAVLMAEWMERNLPGILAKLPTPPTSEAADGARTVPSSADPSVPELTESPGEVVHPVALTGVVPSGAEGVDALRSGVQLACHSPRSGSEERSLSEHTTATPLVPNTKKGGRSGHDTSTAHTMENAL